jgi:hypothetical protein
VKLPSQKRELRESGLLEEDPEITDELKLEIISSAARIDCASFEKKSKS